MAKKKVLFIHPFSASFIDNDLDILKDEFNVIPFSYRGKKDMFKLLRKVISTDLNLSWFAMGHATLAVMFSRFFRKKSVVIAGGWDVVSMPEIGYGAMTGDKRVKKTRYTLKHASRVLAVSESTKKWVEKWIARDDIEVLYLGIDPEIFVPGGEKEEMVVTVGRLQNEVTILVKGLETFARTAELLPHVEFVLIGKHDPEILEKWKDKAPPNLRIIDFMPQKELIEYYQRAKVYAQLSYQESFGSAVAEAMLCECVPVVTKRGALPEVVGDCGFYAECENVEDTAAKIEDALVSDKGRQARERISTMFPLSKRKDNLSKILNECLK